jgi:hypothetical protein
MGAKVRLQMFANPQRIMGNAFRQKQTIVNHSLIRTLLPFSEITFGFVFVFVCTPARRLAHLQSADGPLAEYFKFVAGYNRSLQARLKSFIQGTAMFWG